jgi:hypothetical protein
VRIGRQALAVLALSAAAVPAAAAGTPQYATRSAGPWGASVSLPSAWHVVVIPVTVTPAFLARAERENPAFRGTLPGAIQVGVKLFAYEPPAAGRFASNLNLIVEALPPGVSLRAWLFQGASAAFKHVGTTTTVRIGGLTAVRYVSTKAVTSGAQALLTEEFAFARGNRVYLFTFTSPASAAAVYRPIFERSAASIRFRPTA